MSNPKRKQPLKLSRKDYTQLEFVAVRAILGNKKHVRLLLSYWDVPPPGFPRKYKWKRDGDLQIFLVKSKELLQWVNEKVPGSVTPEKLWMAQGKFWNFYKELEE